MNKSTTAMAILLCACSCTRLARLDSPDDYSRVEYIPTHATGFKIYSLPDDTTRLMLEVYRPDTMRVVIPQGGFKSVVCMSSTYVGTLTTLGKDSTIVAVSGKEYITNPAVKERAVEVGHEGAMDYEALLSAKLEVALIYGIGGESGIAAKLEELAVPYVYVNDFEEQNPLGRAEWLVALGALTGADGAATFRHVETNYHPINGRTPVMLNAPYSGTWFIPGKDNYMSQLIEDAGGKLTAVQTAGTQSSAIDLEEALPALAKADIWLNPGHVATLDDAKNLAPKARFTADVWNQTPDFYESGASRPDLVLGELQRIFACETIDSLHYFVRLK